MKRIDYLKDYQFFSGEASKLARQFGFAGLAVIWIFRNESAGGAIPSPLIPPALLIVVSLGLDFLHYVVAATIWGCFHTKLERKEIPADEDVQAPAWYNWPALVFFGGKLLAMLVAYGFLIAFLMQRCI